MEKRQRDRARGCLLGQLAGDSLGSLVEFKTPEEIRRMYPDGLRELADGGIWNTLAGQPTDDSEMALLLARLLVKLGDYSSEMALAAYRFWKESDPFDCGATIAAGLRGCCNLDSQANGAMMRVSPLGIFGVNHSLEQAAAWARQDAALTHPNEVCVQANALFVMAISHAIRTGASPESLYAHIAGWAEEADVAPILADAVRSAAESPPPVYTRRQGWVLIAFRNALWQLLHAPSLEEGVVDTVMRGGDTDTNAAICGALLGAVHGLEAIPGQWVNAVLNCRPQEDSPGVYRPRPKCFWPVDALELADALLFPPPAGMAPSGQQAGQEVRSPDAEQE